MAGTEFVSLAVVAGLYRVTLVEQEPVDVNVIGADIMRWEQVNGKSFFEGAAGLSRIAWVAWAAMRRQKLTDLEVADFIAQVADLERQAEAEDDEDDEEAAELPTPTGAVGTA